jgi:hypothetical protein
MLNPKDAAAEDAPISTPIDVAGDTEIGGAAVGGDGSHMEEVAKGVIRLFGIRTI